MGLARKLMEHDDPRHKTHLRIAVAVAAALLGGAVLLAVTRADALLLDLAALGICF